MNYDLDSASEVLRRTPETLRALLADLPDEWLHGREDADAWSPYQVCGHLAHIEECDWIDRTRVILEHGTTQPFVPVDREAGFARFAGWSIDALLDRFAEQRATNLEVLQTLVKPSDLDQQGLHPDLGPVTLAQLLATWVVHDFNHLHQIVKTMAKLYGDAVGPWRAFLPILGAT